MPHQTNSINQAQIVYFSHGGGPLPILGDPGHEAMVTFMRALPGRLKRPEAIIVISAHWEAHVATVSGAKAPTMLYDYYGFADEAYEITYPAPGSPGLADRIAEMLSRNQIPAQIDAHRGFDHGLYIPLKLMYPEADIPAVQLSLLRGLAPAAHFALGEALRDLCRENLLVIGSGFSFHNMRAFSWDGTRPSDPDNDLFQDWLIETCTGSITRDERKQRLIAWQDAPSARYCHPREEHLLPLHVCMGMAGDRSASTIFDDAIMGKRAVAFLW